jgi:hypothetical protein
MTDLKQFHRASIACQKVLTSICFYLWHALHPLSFNHGLKPVATNSEPRWGSSKNAELSYTVVRHVDVS